MLDAKHMAEFLYEVHDSNIIITGGVTSGAIFCPGGCRMCYIKGESPIYTSKLPFIDMEDVDAAIPFLDISHHLNHVSIGDGGLRLSAEAFAHPKIYDIVCKVRDSIPEYITIGIFTSGVLIKESLIPLLEKIPNLRIVLTVGSLHNHTRELLFERPETKKITNLLMSSIPMDFTLFPVGGLEVLKSDISLIKHLRKDSIEGIYTGADKIIMRPVEYTKYHNSHVKLLHDLCYKEYKECVEYVKINYPSFSFASPSLEFSISVCYNTEEIYDYESKFINVSKTGREYMAAISEGSFSYWASFIERNHINNIHPVMIRNESLGGSVNCAGLLTFYDIWETISKIDRSKYSDLIVPSVMINRSERDMIGTSMIDFGKKAGLNVIKL